MQQIYIEWILDPTDCMQKIKKSKNAIKGGGSTTIHSKAKGEKNDGLDLTIFFFFWFSRISRKLKSPIPKYQISEIVRTWWYPGYGCQYQKL